MNILILFATLWVICMPLAYVTFRANRVREFSWNHIDQIYTFYLSFMLGPIVLIVYGIPWTRIVQPIHDWLYKPARW